MMLVHPVRGFDRSPLLSSRCPLGICQGFLANVLWLENINAMS